MVQVLFSTLAWKHRDKIIMDHDRGIPGHKMPQAISQKLNQVH